MYVFNKGTTHCRLSNFIHIHFAFLKGDKDLGKWDLTGHWNVLICTLTESVDTWQKTQGMF